MGRRGKKIEKVNMKWTVYKKTTYVQTIPIEADSRDEAIEKVIVRESEGNLMCLIGEKEKVEFEAWKH